MSWIQQGIAGDSCGLGQFAMVDSMGRSVSIVSSKELQRARRMAQRATNDVSFKASKGKTARTSFRKSSCDKRSSVKKDRKCSSKERLEPGSPPSSSQQIQVDSHPLQNMLAHRQEVHTDTKITIASPTNLGPTLDGLQATNQKFFNQVIENLKSADGIRSVDGYKSLTPGYIAPILGHFNQDQRHDTSNRSPLVGMSENLSSALASLNRAGSATTITLPQTAMMLVPSAIPPAPSFYSPLQMQAQLNWSAQQARLNAAAAVARNLLCAPAMPVCLAFNPYAQTLLSAHR